MHFPISSQYYRLLPCYFRLNILSLKTLIFSESILLIWYKRPKFKRLFVLWFSACSCHGSCLKVVRSSCSKHVLLSLPWILVMLDAQSFLTIWRLCSGPLPWWCLIMVSNIYILLVHFYCHEAFLLKFLNWNWNMPDKY